MTEMKEKMMNGEPYTSWWLYNDDMSVWHHYQTMDSDLVKVTEYKRHLYNGAHISTGCPLEPRLINGPMELDEAREQWLDRVREGFRMLTSQVGMIEMKNDYGTVWLFTNKGRTEMKMEKV